MITGSFAGLNLSMRALYSSTKALDITSQNIANVGTKGYTRRTASFGTFGQDTTGTSNPMFGLGGDCVSVTRMRDDYLDTKMWNQSSISTEWSVKNQYYTQLESIINESSLSDLTGLIDSFSSAMNDFANNPSSTTYRYLVQNRGMQLTNYFNETASQLEELQVELNENIVTQVDEVNDLAERIADLNSKIRNSEILGGEVNTLRDERTLLIDQLSSYGNIEVIEKEYGTLVNGSSDIRVTIKFGGASLIENDKYRQLKCTKRVEEKNKEDVEGLYDISWADGSRLDLSSGKLKATMETRDGTGGSDTAWSKGVPYYIGELNTIAKNFALAFNEGIVNGERINEEGKSGYAAGYTFNSPADATEGAGIRFFTMNNLSTDEFINDTGVVADIVSAYDNLEAKNISLSSDVLDDIGNLFKSFSSTGNNNDTEAINSLLAFTERSDLFGTANLEDYVSGLITNLGVDAKVAKDLNKTHESMMTQFENQRENYSGVSLDEEATNLIRYQQMYKAAAKVMSTFTDIYEILVNSI